MSDFDNPWKDVLERFFVRQTIQGGAACGSGGPHSIDGRRGQARRLVRHQPGSQRLGGFPPIVRDLSFTDTPKMAQEPRSRSISPVPGTGLESSEPTRR